jgi:hypothetical protein
MQWRNQLAGMVPASARQPDRRSRRGLPERGILAASSTALVLCRHVKRAAGDIDGVMGTVGPRNAGGCVRAQSFARRRLKCARLWTRAHAVAAPASGRDGPASCRPSLERRQSRLPLWRVFFGRPVKFRHAVRLGAEAKKCSSLLTFSVRHTSGRLGCCGFGAL